MAFGPIKILFLFLNNGLKKIKEMEDDFPS